MWMPSSLESWLEAMVGTWILFLGFTFVRGHRESPRLRLVAVVKILRPPVFGLADEVVVDVGVEVVVVALTRLGVADDFTGYG